MASAKQPLSPSSRRSSLLRARLGASLQKHRLRQGLTQGQVAELAQMSLKYEGEIERGEANTTLDALERLAAVVNWDPMEAFEGIREPVTEGVRVLLISEIEQLAARFSEMLKWLHALDPALHPKSGKATPPLAEASDPKARPRQSSQRRMRSVDQQ